MGVSTMKGGCLERRKIEEKKMKAILFLIMDTPLAPPIHHYYAGIQDAIYDHENNLVYTDQPSCLSCHNQLYLDGFKHGYDQRWNSYQNQESTQGTSINIYGNNNYVNTAQNNEQSQQGPGPNPNPNSDFNPPSPNCLGSNNIPCDGGPDP